MRKLFYILFLLFVSLSSTFAENEIKIISREDWWADESFRYIDSPEWKWILKDREDKAKKNQNTTYTQEEIDSYKEKQEKLKQMNEILLNDFWHEIELDSINYSYSWNTLAWPESKTKQVKWIVIHHTVSDYDDSYDGIKKIYKYHSLNREWWDIWYNYIIWKNGEIFEWRAGWDYVVAAHDMWNNRATIWIAIMWNYSDEEININQYNALRLLSRHLIIKYDIDLAEKTYFHKECKWDTCDKPLTSSLLDPIIWHRDAWITSCPWDALYKQIDTLKSDLLKDPISIARAYKKRIYKKLEKFSDDTLINVLAKIEIELENEKKSNKQKLKWLLIGYFEYKNKKNISSNKFEDKKIKIRLSYPDKDKIVIKNWNLEFPITRKGNDIYIKWTKFNILELPKKDPESIFEITSWDRKPTWDKEWKYNDNTFRWDLTVYAKNNELYVVNTLNIEDYLKWLWEVSNSEKPEKIKTIITAARSYATWYVTKARKFPWEFYDWVDDPNVFQKYLWYWLEMRSPNINKIVDETKWKVITYDWKLIKPWYFSNSNWKTMSFFDYCWVRYSEQICTTEAKKYPYLQSVVDIWSKWKTKAWHWVWISGAWVSYYAKKWWSYDMIIKYFLKWVDVL